MSRPIERLFAMDEMIRKGDYPSIQTFMDRFEIEERTAYGDVQYLKKQFRAPLQYSRKHGGYFYTLTGWNIAKADAFTEEELDLTPTQWLWNEIARRFGADEALALRRDFVQHLLPASPRLCQGCGQPLPPRKFKWCNECFALQKPNKGQRLENEKGLISTRLCQGCQQPLPPRKHKWCDECFKGQQKEWNRKWYQRLSPEQKREVIERHSTSERLLRWNDDEWREEYNAKRRKRWADQREEES